MTSGAAGRCGAVAAADRRRRGHRRRGESAACSRSDVGSPGRHARAPAAAACRLRHAGDHASRDRGAPGSAPRQWTRTTISRRCSTSWRRPVRRLAAAPTSRVVIESGRHLHEVPVHDGRWTIASSGNGRLPRRSRAPGHLTVSSSRPAASGPSTTPRSICTGGPWHRHFPDTSSMRAWFMPTGRRTGRGAKNSSHGRSARLLRGYSRPSGRNKLDHPESKQFCIAMPISISYNQIY